MDEKAKQTYLEKYRQAKEKGVPFYPDVLFKDAVIALLVFLVLVALAYFVGVPPGRAGRSGRYKLYPPAGMVFPFLIPTIKVLSRRTRSNRGRGCAYPGDNLPISPALHRP